MLLSVQIIEAIKGKPDIKLTINTKIMQFIKIIAPFIIVSIAFIFITWLPISSFGMVIFWGFVVNILLAMTFQKILFIELNNSSKGGARK